jgi:dinuclear metal center YbgI/SA1388 family protein
VKLYQTTLMGNLMKSQDVIKYLDDTFAAYECKDYSQNGVQIQFPAEINKIAFAVDACLASFEAAKELNADILVVHHGLFWGKVEMVVDAHFNRLKFMLNNDIGLYGMHLPLDAHLQIGNNAQLAKLVGADKIETFPYENGLDLGFVARFQESKSIDSLVTLLDEQLETKCKLLPFGPQDIRSIGIVSGGGGSTIGDVISIGCDAFLTGEQDHVLYHVAKEAGINVIMAGHYATETVGVKAVMQAMETDLGLETVFIDHPTGL